MRTIRRREFLITCVSGVVALGASGCRKDASRTHSRKVDANLRPDFESEFDRLFLSGEPLRYQDNVGFLKSIQVTALNPAEREIVRTKLKRFLSAKIEKREYAKDSEHTGVASEIAFLRLQALQLLALVGTREDIEFIENLDFSSEREHPLFSEECAKTTAKLRNK